MAQTNPWIFNFRASTAFVSDGTNQISAGSDGTNIITYANVGTIGSDSVTFGWDSEGALEGRDRDNSEPRLAGMLFNGDAVNDRYFRVDGLTAGLTYPIRVALGDKSAYTNNLVALIKDGVGGSTLATIFKTLIGAGNFIDSTNTEYTPANWLSSNSPINIVLTGTVFTLYLPASALSNRVSTLEIGMPISPGGSSSVNLPLLGVG